MTPQKPTALLIRMDRMGDLILTLPVEQNPCLKDFSCTWFITQGMGFVAEHSVPTRKYHEWKRQWSWSQFLAFTKTVKQLQAEVSVSFHVPWWVNLALFIARVPRRIGVLSQWHSYLFLNKGVRQKRSECQFHEMEYNHRLVCEGLNHPPSPPFPHLQLKSLSDLQPWIPSSYIVVHPGMGGSALNWPVEHYSHLISLLSARTAIAITGTPSDQFILAPLKKQLENNTQIFWLDGKLNGTELITLLANAKVVIAPSTGVAHLAASLSVPTIGIYSSIKVESPQRWGPQGPKVQVFTPTVTPSNTSDMSLIEPSDIASAALAYL